MIHIYAATSDDEYQQIAAFYRAFRTWVVATYPELHTLLGEFLTKLDAETANLARGVPPVKSQLLRATVDGVAAGTVLLTDCGSGRAELRRMWVDPQFRGRQVGRALAEEAIRVAKVSGYTLIRLDTAPRHHAALHLYRQLGFMIVERISFGPLAAKTLPEDLQAGIIVMELALTP